MCRIKRELSRSLHYNAEGSVLIHVLCRPWVAKPQETKLWFRAHWVLITCSRKPCLSFRGQPRSFQTLTNPKAIGWPQAAPSETTTVHFHSGALQLKMRIFKIPTDVLSLWIGSLQLNQCSITKLRVKFIHPHFQNSSETARVSITPFSPGRFKGIVLCTWAYLYPGISTFAHCFNHG